MAQVTQGSIRFKNKVPRFKFDRYFLFVNVIKRTNLFPICLNLLANVFSFFLNSKHLNI